LLVSPQREALRAPEAALFVGISETTFRELVEEGTIG
jgi:predicted DNA-binding transcriptional regulator AlpA